MASRGATDRHSSTRQPRSARSASTRLRQPNARSLAIGAKRRCSPTRSVSLPLGPLTIPGELRAPTTQHIAVGIGIGIEIQARSSKQQSRTVCSLGLGRQLEQKFGFRNGGALMSPKRSPKRIWHQRRASKSCNLARRRSLRIFVRSGCCCCCCFLLAAAACCLLHLAAQSLGQHSSSCCCVVL